MAAIAELLDRVIAEIMGDKDVAAALSAKLKQPFVKNPFAMLEQLQNSEIGSYAHFLPPQYSEKPEEGGTLLEIAPLVDQEVLNRAQASEKPPVE